MLRHQVPGRTKQQLLDMASPKYTPGGVTQGIVHSFHDVATYTSTVTTTLTFFQAARANLQLTNLPTPGSLPDPQFFQIYGFHVDFLIPEIATAIADASFLLWGSGATGEGPPTFTFTLADKIYGPWGLSLLHGTGGVTGYGNVAAAVEWANNATPDGGYYQDGAIVIPPNQGFNARIDWGAAQTLTASYDIKVTMSGNLYRNVV